MQRDSEANRSVPPPPAQEEFRVSTFDCGPPAYPSLDLPCPLTTDSKALPDSTQAETSDPEFGHLPLPWRERIEVRGNKGGELRAPLL